jgi:hypothetical protein
VVRYAGAVGTRGAVGPERQPKAAALLVGGARCSAHVRHANLTGTTHAEGGGGCRRQDCSILDLTTRAFDNITQNHITNPLALLSDACELRFRAGFHCPS